MTTRNLATTKRRRFRLVTLALVGAVGFVACGGNTESDTNSDDGGTDGSGSSGGSAGAEANNSGDGASTVDAGSGGAGGNVLGTDGGGSGGSGSGGSGSGGTGVSSGDSGSRPVDACTSEADIAAVAEAEEANLFDTCEMVCLLDEPCSCLMTEGISAQCSWCYAARSLCGTTDCIAPCLQDANSYACATCVPDSCDAVFDSCAGTAI
ncbi:MAG: hypothetical protein HRU17_16225 [Polyangiaceae bacterium]|nr:hypothetical protein [Polyangiaceae bacterium]